MGHGFFFEKKSRNNVSRPQTTLTKRLLDLILNLSAGTKPGPCSCLATPLPLSCITSFFSGFFSGVGKGKTYWKALNPGPHACQESQCPPLSSSHTKDFLGMVGAELQAQVPVDSSTSGIMTTGNLQFSDLRGKQHKRGQDEFPDRTQTTSYPEKSQNQYGISSGEGL